MIEYTVHTYELSNQDLAMIAQGLWNVILLTVSAEYSKWDIKLASGTMYRNVPFSVIKNGDTSKMQKYVSKEE